MFRLDVFCLVLAMIAVFTGYGVFAIYSFEGAKICLLVLLVLAGPAFLMGRFSRPNTGG